MTPQPIPARGETLAATELFAPATGWPVPLRLALVALTEEVRLLAQVEGPLPAIGEPVVVEQVGDRYVVRTGGSVGGPGGRGEGESPGRGTPRPL